MENPHNHIASFLEKCEIIKMNGVLSNTICLRLLPFSLKDKAKSWFLNSNTNSLSTGMVSPRCFCANISHPGKSSISKMTSHPSLKWNVSNCMHLGSGLRSFNRNVLIMASRISYWSKHSTMVFNNQ